MKKYIFKVLIGSFFLLLTGGAFAEGFVLTDLTGKQQALSAFKGKWVVVNYWATWCPPCLEEIPDLIALSEQRKDVVVLGVVFDYKSEAQVKRFVDENLMSYPIVLGVDSVVNQVGEPDVLPTTYIFNPKGKLAKVKHGQLSRAYLDKVMGVK